MIDWHATPLWQWWDAQLSTVHLSAADVLLVAVTEQARGPVPVRKGYRGLDAMKSKLKQGEWGIIVRLPGH